MDEPTSPTAPSAPSTPAWPSVTAPGQGPHPDPEPSSTEDAKAQQAAEGAELLDELREAIARYVILPSSEALTAVTLWIAAAHIQPALQHAPRLAVVGPAKRCGKSRLLDVITETVHEPRAVPNFHGQSGSSGRCDQVSRTGNRSPSPHGTSSMFGIMWVSGIRGPERIPSPRMSTADHRYFSTSRTYPRTVDPHCLMGTLYSRGGDPAMSRLAKNDAYFPLAPFSTPPPAPRPHKAPAAIPFASLLAVRARNCVAPRSRSSSVATAM